MEHATIRGICAAVLTPLNEHLEPDATKAIPYYRKLLEAGCTALNLLGTTGEASSLRIRARLEFMQAVAVSDLPVAQMMVGTSTAALADTVELSRAAHALGFGGALIMPPRPAASLSDDGIVRYFSAIAEALGGAKHFIYLYNFPRLSGFAFSTAIVDRLVHELPSVVAGIKDSSNDLAYESALANVHPKLAIFPSSECHLLAVRRFALAGCISGTVCLWPHRARVIWDAADDSNGEVAQRELCALRTEVEQHSLIPAVRFLTALSEDDNGWERTVPPLIGLDAVARNKLRERFLQAT